MQFNQSANFKKVISIKKKSSFYARNYKNKHELIFNDLYGY
jgi:hypothetical protein